MQNELIKAILEKHVPDELKNNIEYEWKRLNSKKKKRLDYKMVISIEMTQKADWWKSSIDRLDQENVSAYKSFRKNLNKSWYQH